MPSVLKNAVCGPQKAGTKRPDDWNDISSLTLPAECLLQYMGVSDASPVSVLKK